MTYQQRLQYWARSEADPEWIARLLPSEQWVIGARFYKRSDAEGHFQFLSHNLPSARFRIVFDVLE